MGHNGSIPACTGEPDNLSPVKTFLGVYPRVYGGTEQGDWQQFDADGLSPRVRGNPFAVAVATIGLRSIPACTGEPAYLLHQAHPVGVYPRVYGGTFPVQPRQDRARGLSPRVRGNLSFDR